MGIRKTKKIYRAGSEKKSLPVMPTIEIVESVTAHPNASMLDIVLLKGQKKQIVVTKRTVRQNDNVIFFPIGSVVPNCIDNIVSNHRYLSEQKVREMNFRGQKSFGVVFPISHLFLDVEEQLKPNEFKNVPQITDNASLWKFLGIMDKQKTRMKRISRLKVNKFSMIVGED